MSARLKLEKGRSDRAPTRAATTSTLQKVDVDGPIKFAGADGYRLATRDVTVDLKQRQLASRGPVEGAMPLGQFRRGQLHADLGDRTVVLDGGARLKIVQGAVR